MKPKRSKSASWKVVDGKEGVILHLKTGNYYSLNGTALQIWELCDGKHTLEGIKSRVAGSHPGGPGRMRHDVENFVSALHKEQLIEISL